ncbi:putative ATP-dependent RNA helicase, partial [Tetrabaena socialis]
LGLPAAYDPRFRVTSTLVPPPDRLAAAVRAVARRMAQREEAAAGRGGTRYGSSGSGGGGGGGGGVTAEMLRAATQVVDEYRRLLPWFEDFHQRRQASVARLRKLQADRAALPAAAFRDPILQALQSSQALVVAGDTVLDMSMLMCLKAPEETKCKLQHLARTPRKGSAQLGPQHSHACGLLSVGGPQGAGCGKSTQIPQFLAAAGYRRIAVTQPRRISAVSLARRVAVEAADAHGSSVAFKIPGRLYPIHLVYSPPPQPGEGGGEGGGRRQQGQRGAPAPPAGAGASSSRAGARPYNPTADQIDPSPYMRLLQRIDSEVVSWLRYPSWFNGLATEAVRDIRDSPSDYGLRADVVVLRPTGLPAVTSFTNAGSMRDYSSMQAGAYAITSNDLSSVPMLAAWSRLRNTPYVERVCVNESDPRGLLPPRTHMLLYYRPDVMQQLVDAGRLPDARPPDDWDEVINLLGAHAANVAARAAAGDATPFPTYGLCITSETDCGRLGDVLAAVAASVLQTNGTQQGYVYDVRAGSFMMSEPLLVNGTGWRYAAELLRAMLRYNAPSVPDAEGGKECIDISTHFTSGDCLMTLEWETAYVQLKGNPVVLQPGALAVAPLPGSRRVQDRRTGSATEGALVPCTWELCAASANHDLLYLGTGVSLPGSDGGTNRSGVAAAVRAAAQQLATLALPQEVLVDGAAISGCSPQGTMAVEAAAVAEVLGRLAASGAARMAGPPVNRAPYSVVEEGWLTLSFEGLHTGLDDPQHVVFNKVGSAFKYYGPFLETAKLVGDAAPGGLITLSAQTFARLRNTGAAAGAASGRGRSRSGPSVVVLYAGHHVLSEEAAAGGGGKGKGSGGGAGPAAAAQLLPPRPSSGSGSLSTDHVALRLVSVPTRSDKGADKGADQGPISATDSVDVSAGGGGGRADGAAAAEEWAAGSPLFVAVPAALLCRLAHSAPLRSVRQVAPGTMAAPIGSVVVAFMVGIDVGPVTYSLTESSGRLSYRGKVMNRAARIAGTAAAGQVLASGAVWRAVELCGAGEAAGPACGRAAGQGCGVAGLSLGRLALKGITAPVEVVLCTRGG